MMERYDPYMDPEAWPCPHGCGEPTDDPYGGPCSACWRRIREAEDAARYGDDGDAL